MIQWFHMRKALLFVFFVLAASGSAYLVFTKQKTRVISQPTTLGEQVTRATSSPTFTPSPTRPVDLSVETIFHYQDPKSVSDHANEITILATGDVMPARSVNSKLLKLQDFNYPYAKTADFLRSADVVFINLETPLTPDCEPTQEGMIFCGDQRNVQGLVYAGVDIANVANNHAFNHGEEGVVSTINILKENKIEVTGSGEPVIRSIKGKRFGFLGYNDIGTAEPGIDWAEIKEIQTDVTNLKTKVDFVIVTFHWGVEYTTDPTTRQREIAHATIDAGADLIVGNHPHWVQGTERYKNKFIAYSHGNFVFDQMWSQETREGVVGRYTFNDLGLINVQFYPIIIEDYSQPRFATESEANKILNRMKVSSNTIKTTYK